MTRKGWHPKGGNAKAVLVSERWLPCVGYEGSYEISDMGRVRSLRRVVYASNGKRRTIYGGMLKPRPDKKGYTVVTLTMMAKRKLVFVHRLVAMAFHCDKRNILHNEVAHLDGSRDNCRAENLKWVSHRENQLHKLIHGTHQCGDKNPSAKLTNAQALEIRATKGDRRSIAAQYAISTRTVGDIRSGRSWKRA